MSDFVSVDDAQLPDDECEIDIKLDEITID